jgi:manganese efflux pump family protein
VGAELSRAVIAVIALQAFMVTQLGLRLGSRLGMRLREGAERLAGIALSGLGAALLAEKLVA